MQIDFERLKLPLDQQGGCGPDLENDDQFAQLVAELDGLLPTQSEDFYRFRSHPPDLGRKVDAIVAALSRSRDLRLIVPLVRMAALEGDLAAFERALSLVRHYVETAWEGVHPRAADGDYTLRVVELERLDEFASIVLPLQYARLVADRAGQIAYRDLAIAANEASPRDKETFASPAEIDRLFKFARIETLLAVRDLVANTVAHVKGIEAQLGAVDGGAASVAYPRLGGLLGKMKARLDAALAERSSELPQEALAEAPADQDVAADPPPRTSTGSMMIGVPQPAGRVRGHADAEAALAAAIGYFEASEPSSPALLLVAKAKALIGMTFPQLLQALAPNLLGTSRIEVTGSGFVLAVEALGTAFPPETRPSLGGASMFEASSRVDAAGLLAEVSLWYRASEPSNPVPLLLDRARGMMAKDFTTLLTELTPKA